MPSNDFSKGIAGSPLELAQELIGVIVDRDGLAQMFRGPLVFLQRLPSRLNREGEA